jgi:hypothetical protein
LEFWQEFGNIMSSMSDFEESKHLNFGIFECKGNEDFCDTQRVTENLRLMFFGVKNKWHDQLDFIYEMIDEVLREDRLIEMFDQPGNMFVMFKVLRNCHLI